MKLALRRIHCIGIGGSGMSGIAELLQAEGFAVSGSDQSASETTARLQSLGVIVTLGHRAGQAADAEVVVVSSAIGADNPELADARARGIPVVPRAVMLAELMRERLGIAIAGTHGKTTTTALVASVLREGGADPSWVIGGTLAATGSGAHLGAGRVIVVESDESDASFLHLLPRCVVVTNIDADHMDTYGQDVERLRTAFVDFVQRTPFYGLAVVCSDDAGVQAIVPRLQGLPRRLCSYGLGAQAELRAIELRALPGARMAFTATQSGFAPLAVELALAGEHNVRNALAALAVARAFGLPDAATQRALAGFAGVGRRFQRGGEWPTRDGGRATLIDDYGHHPVEMAAVLSAARAAFPGRRLVLAFQPHRYTRTRDLLQGFAEVLRDADRVLLSDVYAAGEATIAGADSAALATALQAQGGTVAWRGPVDRLPAALVAELRDGDVAITMGAGSIAGVPAALWRLKPDDAFADACAPR